MSKFNQTNRPLAVKTPLGPDDLLLEGFHGKMAISELFRFELDLLAERATSVPFEKLLGQSISVSLATSGGVSQSFNGIVSNLKRVRRDQAFSYFKAVMVPRFWLWTKNVQSRVFQHLSIPDVLKEVLKELRPNLVLDLRGNYQPREYCVQYRESDFDFASRIMEDEGIYYYFQHAADKHVMVVTDVQAGLPELPQPTLILREEAAAVTAGPCVSRWEKGQGVQSGACTLWDQCFELPGRLGAAPEPAAAGNGSRRGRKIFSGLLRQL